jgi:hypothetical protein
MLRHVAAFFALGLVLFALKYALAPAPQPPLLVVSVPQQASAADVERAIDEAVLVDQALAHGGALIDPLVRAQLLRNMHMVSPEADGVSDAVLLERALALGVQRVDPLIKQRLVFQAQQLLRARAQVKEPTDAELERYRLAHTERYRQAERISLAHAFVSRSRRGAQLAEAAAQLGARLTAENPNAQDAFRHSDPSILPRQLERATVQEIAARFGDAFAEGLVRAPMNRWHGPVESSYGVHFVLVYAREPERLPSVNELRARLRGDRLYDLKNEAVARRLRTLRTQYRIEVRR